MATPAGNDDQTLIWRLVLQAAQAGKDLQDFRKQVDELKAQMKQTAKATGESFNAIKASAGNALKKNLDDAKASVKGLRDEIKILQDELKAGVSPTTGNKFNADEIRDYKDQLRDQKDLLRDQTQEVNTASKAYKDFQAVAPTALRELNKETQQTAGAFGNLNNIARVLFGITLLSLGAQALRTIVGFLQDAGRAALDFSKAMFQLEVGVRALRRSGIDVTTSEIIDNLERINSSVGNLFSQLELIKGAAEFTNLIRDLGLTRDEIFQLQEAVVKLAIVNGRSMDDVQKTVALALSSGYTEGLQRLGVSINRLTIAEEANRIGFKGGYTALSEQARAQATFNLLMQKSTKYADDLSEAQKRLFGEIQGTEKEIENTKAALGEALLPLQLAWNKALLLTVKILSRGGLGGAITFISTIATIIKALPAVWEQANKGADSFIDKLKIVWDFLTKMNQAWKEFKPFAPVISQFGGFGQAEVPLGDAGVSDQQDKLLSLLEEYGSEAKDIQSKTAEKLKDLETDLQNDLAEIIRKGVDKRAEIWRDYWDDIAKIDREGAQKEAELLRDYNNKIKDINTKLGFNLQDVDIKYNFDVAETAVKLNEDIAKANETYRQKELDRERKYNEELLRLREDYLVDLEEALSNRDAKAVLRARKELILAKDRAARENEANKIKNQEGLAEDIKDAQLRRESRLRELAFELEQRRAELERQAQFDREVAFRNYQQDVADFKLAQQQKKEERAINREIQLREQAIDEANDIAQRKAKYESELAQLQAFNDAQIKMIGDNLAQQAELMGLGSDAVMEVINAYFGEGGVALQIFDAYTRAVEEYVARLKKLTSGFSASISGVDVSKFQETPTPKKTGYAKGGAAVADKPTDVTFGEVPELALFAPLDQLDKLSGLFGGGFGGRDKKGDKIDMRVSLSPGLVAEIVNKSANNIANVMLEVQRT